MTVQDRFGKHLLELAATTVSDRGGGPRWTSGYLRSVACVGTAGPEVSTLRRLLIHERASMTRSSPS